jgi:hypothetical protein
MSWRLNDVTITVVDAVAPSEEERSAAAPDGKR